MEPTPSAPAPIQPPVPPAPAAPAAVPPIPAASRPDGDDEALEEELASLSPMAVLGKGIPSAPAPIRPPVPPAPAAPAPGPAAPLPTASASAPVPPSRPEAAFILPRPEDVRPPTPTPVPQPVPVRVPAAAVPSSKPLPVRVAVPAPADAPVVPARHGRGFAFLLAGAGLLIALALLGGGAYVLASAGTRLPFAYAYVSGLPADGIGTAAKAAAFVGGSRSYQVYGAIGLSTSDAGSSALPTDGSSGSATVTKVASQITADLPVYQSVASGASMGRASLTLNSRTPVAAYFSSDPTEGGSWKFDLPTNTVDPLVAVPDADLKKSLLYPSFAPVPLKVLLSAFKSETAYQKVSGRQVARYGYDVDAGALKSYFPDGAVLKSVTGEAYYAWGSAEPLQAAIRGSFEYQGVTYSLSEDLSFEGWNEQLPTGKDTDMDVISANLAAATPQSGRQFLPQFGVDLAAIPNTLVATTSFTPIVPTGETAASAGDAVTATPPLPVQPASDEAKARDAQRLADLADLQSALEGYKKDTGAYPISGGLIQTGSAAALFDALVPDYLTAMPVDPLKDTYWYEYSSDGSTYVLRAAAEDFSNAAAKLGAAYYYFEVTNS